MNTIDKDNITNEELFNAYLSTPESIRYFISSAKGKINRRRNNWEDDCYKEIVCEDNNAYPIITSTSQTIVKLHDIKEDDELTNYFDKFMFEMPFDFNFELYESWLNKYCSDCSNLLNNYLFNLISNKEIPANVTYYINRCKTILGKKAQKFENECLNEISSRGVNAYPVILAASQIIMKIHRYKSTQELSSFFGYIMSSVDDTFLFDDFKNLVLEYSTDYLFIVNAYLFDLTDVSNKVKNYIKNK